MFSIGIHNSNLGQGNFSLQAQGGLLQTLVTFARRANEQFICLYEEVVSSAVVGL